MLDSSVLVSAFITPRGEVMRLLRQPARGRYRLYLSEAILAETAETLLTKETVRRYAAYTDEDVRGYLGWLLSEAQLVDELPNRRVVPDDADDDMVIATAVAAKAGYLVTGDRHLLVLERYHGIAIVSPRRFLEVLASEAEAA